MKIGELRGKEDDSAGKPLAAQVSRLSSDTLNPCYKLGRSGSLPVVLVYSRWRGHSQQAN